MKAKGQVKGLSSVDRRPKPHYAAYNDPILQRQGIRAKHRKKLGQHNRRAEGLHRPQSRTVPRSEKGQCITQDGFIKITIFFKYFLYLKTELQIHWANPGEMPETGSHRKDPRLQHPHLDIALWEPYTTGRGRGTKQLSLLPAEQSAEPLGARGGKRSAGSQGGAKARTEVTKLGWGGAGNCRKRDPQKHGPLKRPTISFLCPGPTPAAWDLQGPQAAVTGAPPRSSRPVPVGPLH